MKRSILSLALALALCLGLLPTVALAASYTEAVPCQYDYALPFSEGLAEVLKDDKYGFIDKTGKEVIPCKYDTLSGFSEGFAVAYLEGRGYDIIDKTGQELLCKYDYVSWDGFSEGFVAVSLDGKWGFMDKTGKETVPCKYDDVERFREGLAAVELNGKWGFIDTAGKEVVPCQYDGTRDFHNGFAVVCIAADPDGYNGLWGCIDRTGKEIIPCQYSSFLNFGANMDVTLVSMRDAGIALIDKTGQVIVPFGKYTGSSMLPSGAWTGFSGGLLAVEENGTWGYIDSTGQEVIPCTLEYEWAGPFSGGLAAVQNFDGKLGAIDTTGKEIVPCKYEPQADLNAFYDGFMTVAVGAGEKTEYGYTSYKFGFINHEGQEAIPCMYDEVLYFAEGFVPVCLNGKWGYVAETGAEVVPCQYDIAEGFSEGLAAVCRDGKWGFISINSSAAAPLTAQPSTQTVNVDGRNVEFAMYALNGGSVNYIRVRDLAALLNGTAAQFEVGWNGNITLTSKSPYTGATDKAPFNTEMAYTVYGSPTYVDGQAVNLDAIQIEYQGGGFTYYKLRDLAQALGFNVGWSTDKGVYVETDKPYDSAN